MPPGDDGESAGPKLAPGLYVVATPIGNLEDLTQRALRVLRSVDLIACEDTRHTRRLLDHYSIRTPTVSYHEHNERERAAELVNKLAEGATIALVSDAGTPAVSDPGYRIVHATIERGIAVISVPGPSAAIAALAASGLPTDEFCFHGFLPARRGQRRSKLETLISSPTINIFFEAPHRIREAMEDIVAILGADRWIVLARELTKIHEEFLRGSAGDILRELEKRSEIKGEMVLLIGKSEKKRGASHARVADRLDATMREGMDEKSAIKRLAKELGISRDEVFRELQRARPKK
jgi:16S rRNA (cytidine1402-2'-O)-methyltransferase